MYLQKIVIKPPLQFNSYSTRCMFFLKRAAINTNASPIQNNNINSNSSSHYITNNEHNVHNNSN